MLSGIKKIFSWIVWHLWGRRRHKKQLEDEIKRLNELMLGTRSAPHHGSVSQINVMISYDDMHLKRYREMERSRSKQALPPPDIDDEGLN